MELSSLTASVTLLPPSQQAELQYRDGEDVHERVWLLLLFEDSRCCIGLLKHVSDRYADILEAA